MDGIEKKVCEVVGDIWSSILNLKIIPGDHAVEAARRAQTRRSLTVCVQVTGTWEGSVLLYSTHALARLMASIMFDCPPDEVNDEDYDANEALYERLLDVDDVDAVYKNY